MVIIRTLIVAVTALAVWSSGLLLLGLYLPRAITVIGIGAITAWSAVMAVRRSSDQTGFALAAFAMALSLLLSGHLAAGLPPGNFWVWVSWAGGVAAGPLFLYLVTLFPVARPELRKLVVAGFVVTAALAAAELAGWLGPEWHPASVYADAEKAAHHLHGEATSFYIMMPGLEFTAGGLAAGLAVLVSTARRARASGSRLPARQAEVVILGLLLSAVPFIAYLPGLIPPGAGQFMSLSLLFFALLPAAASVALVRPSLYDPSALLRKAMVWVGVSAGALLSYLLLVRPLAVLGNLFNPHATGETAVFIAAFGVALLIRPIQYRLERLVDETFFPERVGFRAFLEETSQALATTLRPEELRRLTTETIPLRLRASGGLLLVMDSAGLNMAPLTTREPLIPLEHPLRSLAEQTRGPAAFRSRETAAQLGIQIPALMLPLWVGDRLVGLYFLGARESGDMFDEEQLRELTVLSHHLAVAVENVRGYHKIEELNRRSFAEVEERNHIAREIHDTLAQGLTGITLQLEIAQMFRESNPEKAEKAISRALELTRTNLAHARRSVVELRASALGTASLPEALAAVVRQAAADTGAIGHFRLEGAYAGLPGRVETALYRIAQEALHNVIKYARASTLEVILRVAPEGIELTLEDDGVGFDPVELPQAGSDHGGFGLAGMRERVRLVGGQLLVESSPGVGTRLVVQVPTKEEGA